MRELSGRVKLTGASLVYKLRSDTSNGLPERLACTWTASAQICKAPCFPEAKEGVACIPVTAHTWDCKNPLTDRPERSG
jgi:hypothetical protein